MGLSFLDSPVVGHTTSWDENRDALRRAFDTLVLAVPGMGGKSVEIRFGTATMTFTASTTSALGAVAHGLGCVPQHVSLTPHNVTAFGHIAALEWHNANDTTFDINALVPSAITASVTVTWIAIG